MMFARLLLLLGCCIALSAAQSHADHEDHDDGEWLPGSMRIIVADNNPANTRLVAVDLPSFNVSHQLSLPGVSQALGLTTDRQHVGVFRARAGNDQHFMTFVHTGLTTMPGLVSTSKPAKRPGYMRRMVVTKSLLIVNGSDAIGGVEDGTQLVYHPAWKTNLLYAENHGLILGYNAQTSAQGAKAFLTTVQMRVPVGHYHVMPVGDYIFVPHTGASQGILLGRDGKTVRSLRCAACHGAQKYETKDKAVIVAGCNTSVVVMTLDLKVKPARINTQEISATNPRIGSFVTGAPGVLWTAANPAGAAPFFYRTDLRRTPSTLTKVNHPGSSMGDAGAVIKALGVSASKRMLAIHRAGLLVLYDGESGAALGQVMLRPGGFLPTDPAPNMVLHESTLFVSVPSSGKLQEVKVNLSKGSMTLGRVADVGGNPGPLLVAH